MIEGRIIYENFQHYLVFKLPQGESRLPMTPDQVSQVTLDAVFEVSIPTTEYFDGFNQLVKVVSLPS